MAAAVSSYSPVSTTEMPENNTSRAWSLRAIKVISGKSEVHSSNVFAKIARLFVGIVVGELAALAGVIWHTGCAGYYAWKGDSHMVKEHLQSAAFDGLVATGVGAVFFGALYAEAPVALYKAECVSKAKEA